MRAFPRAVRTLALAATVAVAAVGCKREDYRAYPGIAEAELIRLSAPGNGNLSALSARRGEKVAVGTRLFSIAEPEEFAARDLAAQRLRQIETRRAREGTASDAEELDNARAQIAQAEWKLSLKSADAPVSGVIVETSYAKGDRVSAGALVVAILPVDNMKIRFEVPLSVAVHLQSGRRVTVHCATCAGPVNAVVTYISPFATGESAAGGSGGLLYGVEARPDSERAALLKPGEAVTVVL